MRVVRGVVGGDDGKTLDVRIDEVMTPASAPHMLTMPPIHDSLAGGGVSSPEWAPIPI